MEIIRKDITEINIGKRIRRTVSDLKGLSKSLAKIGQIEPVILAYPNDLLQGFRRIAACGFLMADGKGIGDELFDLVEFKPDVMFDNPRKMLPGQIDCVVLYRLTPKEKVEIELFGNLHHKNLTQVEMTLGFKKIKDIMSEEGPVSSKEIAHGIGIGQTVFDIGIKVAELVEQGRKDLLQSESIIAAFNKIGDNDA